MKAIYSTQLDKQRQELSEGEIVKSSDNSDKYASNYEGDTFEEEDPDDDFNLPRDHEQNYEPFNS